MVLSFATCSFFALVAADNGGPFNTLQATSIKATTPNPTTLNATIGRLAADPIRPQIYATVPGANSVIVVDTASLQIVKTIPVGSMPVCLVVSNDARKLWVANSGSTTTAISVIDLDTLTVIGTLPAPTLPYDIKEGLGNRLYLTPGGSNSPPLAYGIMQIDSQTGAFQGSVGSASSYRMGFLEVSPDRRTLFFGDAGVSPSTLERYDISTATPTLLQATNFNAVGSNGESLRVSHNGEFLVFPNGGGNGPNYVTFEIPTSNLNSVNGSFEVGAYPNPAAFSNDDTILYHTVAYENVIKVFDTRTFTSLDPIPLGTSESRDFRDIVVDRSGRWLFVGTSTMGFPTGGDLRIFDLGRSDPLPQAQLANISTRGFVNTGDDVLIGGLVINGTGPKKVLVRVLGPSLVQFGVSGALANPQLELYQGQTLLATNDGWMNSANAGEITASGYAPPAAGDSAIFMSVQPGKYTAVVRGVNGTKGLALIEAYNLDSTSESKLANISTRGFVQTGENVMIAGIAIRGSTAQKVVIRGLGPTLAQFGVPSALVDPFLDLRDANGNSLATNDDWKSNQQAEIAATGYTPPNDKEAAILRTLIYGNYTAILSGVGNTTGNALVEVYAVD